MLAGPLPACPVPGVCPPVHALSPPAAPHPCPFLTFQRLTRPILQSPPRAWCRGTLLTPLLVLAMGMGEALLVHAGALHDACLWCMPRKRQRGRQACNRTRVERGRGRLLLLLPPRPQSCVSVPPPGRLGWSGKLTVLLVQLTIPACARPLYAHARACQRTNSVTGFATRWLRTRLPAPRGPSKDERVVGWRRQWRGLPTRRRLHGLLCYRCTVCFMCCPCAYRNISVLCPVPGWACHGAVALRVPLLQRQPPLTLSRAGGCARRRAERSSI